MVFVLRSAARMARRRFAEWLAARTKEHAVNAWASTLSREDKVRDILGAQRFESTEDAAWRVAGAQRHERS